MEHPPLQYGVTPRQMTRIHHDPFKQDNTLLQDIVLYRPSSLPRCADKRAESLVAEIPSLQNPDSLNLSEIRGSSSLSLPLHKQRVTSSMCTDVTQKCALDGYSFVPITSL